MNLILCIYPWSLYRVRCHILPVCWYWHGGNGYKAEERDDGLIYRAGFKTEDEAIAWGKKQDMVPQDFERKEE